MQHAKRIHCKVVNLKFKTHTCPCRTILCYEHRIRVAIIKNIATLKKYSTLFISMVLLRHNTVVSITGIINLDSK